MAERMSPEQYKKARGKCSQCGNVGNYLYKVKGLEYEQTDLCGFCAQKSEELVGMFNLILKGRGFDPPLEPVKGFDIKGVENA